MFEHRVEYACIFIFIDYKFIYVSGYVSLCFGSLRNYFWISKILLAKGLIVSMS